MCAVGVYAENLDSNSSSAILSPRGEKYDFPESSVSTFNPSLSYFLAGFFVAKNAIHHNLIILRYLMNAVDVQFQLANSCSGHSNKGLNKSKVSSKRFIKRCVC